MRQDEEDDTRSAERGDQPEAVGRCQADQAAGEREAQQRAEGGLAPLRRRQRRRVGDEVMGDETLDVDGHGVASGNGKRAMLAQNQAANGRKCSAGKRLFAVPAWLETTLPGEPYEYWRPQGTP